MRLILIPGFGEDQSVFEKIYPYLPGEKVFVDHWQLLSNSSWPGLDALKYAGELVAQFHITKEDVVIGHSMGGWIALHIKQLTDCSIVQISSWTDGRKVVRPVNNRYLIYCFAKRGLAFTVLSKCFFILRHYKGKPSEEIFARMYDNLISGNKIAVLNQLRVIFNPVKDAITVKPDLRIHARGDHIIRYPDEPALEIPGDHFSLYTHPELVYQPILDFLRSSAASV